MLEYEEHQTALLGFPTQPKDLLRIAFVILSSGL
jgi:hypothetical protein